MCWTIDDNGDVKRVRHVTKQERDVILGQIRAAFHDHPWEGGRGGPPIPSLHKRIVGGLEGLRCPKGQAAPRP